MQLILDAEDIDIRRNMSIIEQESLNEKFLTNKIIEHLADDICSGNKENIQKQNNVISEQAGDGLDTGKETTSKEDVTSTINLNGENSKENFETDNVENLKICESNSKNTDTEPECDPVTENVNEEKSQSNKNDCILGEPDKNSVESPEKENKLSCTNEENVVDSDTELTNVQNAVDPVILDNDEGVTESPATEEANPIILKNTAEDNELLEEIESDPIILDCNAPNNGSSIKETDVVLSGNAEDKEPLIISDTTNLNSVNNAAKNENAKLNVTSDDESSAVRQADIVLSHDDVAADDSSLTKTVTTEKINPNNKERIKIDEVPDKTVDKDLEESSSQKKVSAMQSSNSKEMNSFKSDNTIINSNVECNAIESNNTIEIDDDDVKTNDNNCESSAEIQELDVEMQEVGEKNVDNRIIAQKNVITETQSAVSPEPKRVCKLSNNLDIFSDEEEEEEKSPKSTEVEPSVNNTLPATEKESISIEDDDEIMVIDEDSIVKDSTSKDESKTASDKTDKLTDTTVTNEEVCTEITITQDNKAVIENSTSETDISAAQEIPKVTTDNADTETSKSADKVEETQQKVKKPLLPKNFVRSYKKNLADMTRDELEEFCILKIVESIVDRSNLGEIKSQLKTLTQTMEECKKKCLMLSKQNKDLQVVLKSVQEEQKSASDVHITPLKITRSVGMQVVMMVDKNNMRKKTANGVNSPTPATAANPANNKSGKSPLPATNTKSEKKANNPQIPVPRLVPAVPAAKTNQIPLVNNSPKQGNINIIPNGLKVGAPVTMTKMAMAEKRPRSQSITVDLTDDEPPAKQQTVQRNIGNQGVRTATPQQPNLIASPRLGQSINSPRKVYIPISGQAQNLRASQTIMLKSVPGLHPRLRCPPPHPPKVPQAASPARLGRITPHRHPAPLPEAPKQYQPPNWKTLPPAPDLKLSKVENGIVISWKIDNYNEDNHEVIASYQLYAYQETQSPPNTALWKKIGDVKALPLPMACTLTQFMTGFKYYFAVRAVDVRSRFGPFSLPGSILLLNKM